MRQFYPWHPNVYNFEIKFISKFQKLQENIEMKRTDVEKMMELCPLLANLASDEEAAELETTFKTYMTRYENLNTRAAECGVLLQQVF